VIRSKKCEVLSIRLVGAYWSLTLVAPEIAEQARPGQFIEIAVPGGRTFLGGVAIVTFGAGPTTVAAQPGCHILRAEGARYSRATA